MTDLHLHTRFSHDSEETAENYVLTAKARGYKFLGFTEHYDYDVFLDGGFNECPLPDLSAYSREISDLSAKYPEIKILKGAELGYSADATEKYKELLQSGNFDYAILSVHTVKGRGDCYYTRFFDGFSKKQAYEAYFKAVLESVRSDINYQIAGHIGYIERYAPYKEKRVIYSEFGDVLDEILKEIILRDKCLEINTSAKGTGHITVPDLEIIERYLSLGGKNFSLGSDAHSVSRFAENFTSVKNFLVSLGVTHTCLFEKGVLFKEEL